MHVGRLDVDTTGALLFTTDGVLCHRLLGPGSGHAAKRYVATLRGGPHALSAESIAALRKGVRLPGRKRRRVCGTAVNIGTVQHPPRTESARVNAGVGGERGVVQNVVVGERIRQTVFRESAVVELTVTEGANHQVKHMLSLVGRPLWRLHRKAFCGIGVEGLAEGQCRELRREEVETLYEASKANVAGGSGAGAGAGGGHAVSAGAAAADILDGNTADDGGAEKAKKRKRA